MSLALNSTNNRSSFPGSTPGIDTFAGAIPPRRRFRRTGEYVAGIAVLIGFAAASLIAFVIPDKIGIDLVLGIGLVAALIIIRWPVSGTYMTAAIAILFDAQSSPYVHTLLSDSEIFRNILYVNAPEIIMLVALASALFRRFHLHKGLSQGPLFWPLAAFGSLVIVGEIVGMLGGGDFKTSLWEIRPLLYLVIFYFLAVNSITEPRHIRALIWITIICIFLRCIEGVYRYILMPPDLRSVVEVVLEHDDSLFMVLGLALLPIVAFWRAWLSRWMLRILIVMAPLTLYIMAINHRRAAYLCLILLLVAALPFAWLSLRSKKQREWLVKMLVFGAIGASAYLAIFWNSSNGIIAEPAQAVRSAISPDERDYTSNLYRDTETANLQFTIGTSPIIGLGFGRTFIVIHPMVNLTKTWPFQFVMPHNNMLWIWMRTGIFGFMNFWAVVGMAFVLLASCVKLGAARLRTLLWEESIEKDQPANRPKVQSAKIERQECAEFLVLAFLALTVLVSLLGLAQVDQGLMSFRLMMYAGLALGALAAAWNMYGSKLRSQQTIDAPQLAESEAKTRTSTTKLNRRRVRVLSGVN